MKKTLTLIDLSSIFWQSWHASANSEIGTALEKTINKVQRHVNNDNPVAICIDSPPYKRKDIDPDYKAQRDAPSPAALGQLEQVIKDLKSKGFPIMEAQGYEADDIIATIIENRKEQLVNIISSDKDLSQLVCMEVTQTSPLTGVTYDTNSVVEKFGVMPTQLGDLLALTGDKADNIPGVPGVGEKTAAVLLKTHGWENLVNLIDCGDPDNQIAPPGVRQKLLDNFDNLLKSRELVRLMTDAPINIDLIYKPRTSITTKEEDPNVSNYIPNQAPADNKVAPKKNIVKTSSIIKPESWSMRLEPNSAESAYNMCKHLYQSGLYTKFRSQDAIFAIVLRGRSLGLDATTALDGFHVVEGQPCPSAPLIVGLILRSNACDYFKCIKTTPEIATYITHRSDDPQETPQELSYTIQQAQNAELTNLTRNQKKTNWHKRPETMLRWRCATELARMVYPDVVAGLYTPDEISNGDFIEAEVEVTE